MKRKQPGKLLIIPSDFPSDRIPPTELRKMRLEGPNLQNADIVKVVRGVEKYRWAYSDFLHSKLDAEIPKVPVTKVEDGEEVTEMMGEEELPDLRKGLPPLPQAIVHECGWENGVSLDYLREYLEELGWFEKADDFSLEGNLRECLDELEEKRLLTYNDVEGTWHSGPRTLEEHVELGREGYDVTEGPYPVVLLMRDEASRRGGMRKHQILSLVDEEWNWTRTREGAEYWLEKAVEMGRLESPREGFYEPR